MTSQLNLVSPDLGDPLLQMLPFLSPAERLPLTETCCCMRDLVERHCQLALEKLIKDHNPDESFLDRIRELPGGSRASSAAAGAAGSPATDASDAPVPYRYLTHAASRNHLYTVPFNFTRKDKNIYQIDKSRRSLFVVEVFVDKGWLLRQWDLAKRQWVQGIEIPDALESFNYTEDVLFFCGNCVVFYTVARIYVCTFDENGHFLHTHHYHHTTGEIDAVAKRDESNLVFIDRSMCVYQYNIHSQAAQMQMLLVVEAGAMNTSRLGVRHGRWLIVSTTRSKTIQVHDLENNCALTHKYSLAPQDKWKVPLDVRNSIILYSYHPDMPVKVLELDDNGKLVSTTPIRLVPRCNNRKRCPFQGSFQSQIFLSVFHPGSVALVNAKSGLVETTLKLRTGTAAYQDDLHFSDQEIVVPCRDEESRRYSRPTTFAVYVPPGYF